MSNIEDLLTFIEEEDVRFIRLAFFDVLGIQRNISILPDHLPKVLKHGIEIDANALPGLTSTENRALYLKPDISSAKILPWRSVDGSVICMICDLFDQDQAVHPLDCRRMLKDAMKASADQDVYFDLSTQFEFYLFLLDETGRCTTRPLDQAGYMDVAPDDKGENIRRELCMTLGQMGLQPQASYHQCGPGQMEIDFHSSLPLQAADEASMFKWVVRTVSESNGLYADFGPKPIEGMPGNGMHIVMKFSSSMEQETIDHFLAGILAHISELTLFFNPGESSYERLGKQKAPDHVGWSTDHLHELIHIDRRNRRVAELRSPDPMCNPYLSFSLLIYAGLDGVEKKLPLEAPLNNSCDVGTIKRLPQSKQEAFGLAYESEWVRRFVPERMITLYR